MTAADARLVCIRRHVHGADCYLPPEGEADPVECWLAANRCCGAPQLCGARCMDDEDSATGARVARELDDARGRIVELEERLALAERWRVRVLGEGGPHRSVQVFVGPQDGSRALCGDLTVREDEAAELVELFGEAAR